ncbi:MAG: PHP domain-containing protein [Candidatus Geothermincolia bacterium]
MPEQRETGAAGAPSPRIKTDLHTHTISSGHGFSTVREICADAGPRGIEMVGITDHGPAMPGGAHIYHFTNLVVLPRVLSGVRILRSAECNILDTDGKLDVHDRALGVLDIVHAGIHPLTGFEGDGVEDNTRAAVAAVESGRVDVLVHPGNPSYPLDYGTVARAAASKGVLIEINNSSFTVVRKGSLENCRAVVREAIKSGASICVGSDAHDASLVGVFDKALELIDEEGFPGERIVNREASSVLEFLRSRGRKEILFE